MMIYNRILVFSLSLMSLALYGQKELTLERAIAMGMENNFQILIDDTNIQVAENNDSWARAGRGVVVDLTGSFTNNLTKDNNPASFLQGTFYNGSLGASVGATYVPYAGGRIKVLKEQLGKQTESTLLSKQANINAMVTDIYQRYHEVLLQQERLEVFRTAYTLSSDKVAYENTKREFGTSNMYNIVQFESAVVADSISMIQQRQVIVISKTQLFAAMDMDYDATYVLTERLSVIPEEIDREELQSALTEDNFTLRSLEIVSALNRLNTRLAQAAKRPTVSLNGSVGFSEQAFKFFGENPNTGVELPLIFSNRLTGNIGAQVNWNLYDGGVRNADIQNAKLQEEVDRLTVEEAQISISNQLDLLAVNYNNQLILLDLADDQISLAQKNLDISDERLRSGQLTSIDYRNVQTQYLNAAFNKVNAIYDLIITKSQIDELVGVFAE